jgi:hypothetical protein
MQPAACQGCVPVAQKAIGKAATTVKHTAESAAGAVKSGTEKAVGAVEGAASKVGDVIGSIF